MINTKKRITRFPPSPTSSNGIIHLGSLRTAYHNWLHAKSVGGKFIFRIDNTDQERNNLECEKSLYKMMDWAGLNFDYTFKQSDRIDRYNEVIESMIKNGTAINKDNAVYLLPDENKLSDFNFWTDEISGNIKISQDDKDVIRKLILRKSNGDPTYHFASVIDDIDYGITDILRGTDGISNSARQIFLIKTLNKDIPKFYHTGLIFKDGKKMSKRDNCSDLNYYINNGYSCESLLNYALKLGWSHPNPNFDRECPLINKDKALNIWNEGKIKNSASNFDISKLDWYNKKYNLINNINANN